MKNFVAILVTAIACFGLLAFTNRPVRPSGGYLPITEVQPVQVVSNGSGYNLKFLMDLAADWGSKPDYQLVGWKMSYKPHGVRAEYALIPSGPFQPVFNSRRASYNATVYWSPGTYDVEIYVEEFFENFYDDSQTLHYTVTIP